MGDITIQHRTHRVGKTISMVGYQTCILGLPFVAMRLNVAVLQMSLQMGGLM